MKCIYSAQRTLILASFSLMIVVDAINDDVGHDDNDDEDERMNGMMI